MLRSHQTWLVGLFSLFIDDFPKTKSSYKAINGYKPPFTEDDFPASEDTLRTPWGHPEDTQPAGVRSGDALACAKTGVKVRAVWTAEGGRL